MASSNTVRVERIKNDHFLLSLTNDITPSQVTARLSELETTIEAGDRHRDNVLTSTAYQIETWTALVRRKKAIFHTLNMLSIDVTRKCLVAEGWCPVFAKPKVRARSWLKHKEQLVTFRQCLLFRVAVVAVQMA